MGPMAPIVLDASLKSVSIMTLPLQDYLKLIEAQSQIKLVI